jgi:hypothetical protein
VALPVEAAATPTAAAVERRKAPVTTAAFRYVIDRIFLLIFM